MANKKGSHQLTRADRIKIEALLKEGLSKAKIAKHRKRQIRKCREIFGIFL